MDIEDEVIEMKRTEEKKLEVEMEGKEDEGEMKVEDSDEEIKEAEGEKV